MARYRKVDIRVWSDERFCSLSALRPSGQALWLVLMVGPQTGIIPGLCAVGRAGFAELLRWSEEAFAKAFAEVERMGMVEADWKARLVWIPKSILYNPPASPNVVKSWADTWDELPECELKAKAWRTLNAFLEGMGQAFLEAFEQACPLRSRKASPNQEQDQEQDQEKTPHSPPARGAPEPIKLRKRHRKTTLEEDLRHQRDEKRNERSKWLNAWLEQRRGAWDPEKLEPFGGEEPTREEQLVALQKHCKATAEEAEDVVQLVEQARLRGVSAPSNSRSGTPSNKESAA